MLRFLNVREGSACLAEGADCVPRKTQCTGFKEFRVVGKCKTDEVCNSVGYFKYSVEGDICRPYLFRYPKKHSVMIAKSQFFFCSERCPGAECLFHQRSLGGHKMDNRPTDSNGNLCGEGENAGKPYSHYFDLTLCAKRNSTSQPCSSVQVYMLSIPLLT